MTYVIGFAQPNCNTIIADSRVSWRNESGKWEGDNSILKTGLLFKGCIFGRVGNNWHSRQFIRDFKGGVETRGMTPQQNWSRFQEFSSLYGYSGTDEDHFRLLISSRHAQEPQFFLLDSRDGLSKLEGRGDCWLLTYGSGKQLLDQFVSREFTSRIREFQNYAIREKLFPTRIALYQSTPYLLCLWLSEMSLTFEKSKLEEHKVGGTFHFVLQTNANDEPQRPAIYMFSSADRKKREIYTWLYRISYAAGGLYVEAHFPPEQRGQEGYSERHAFFDGAGRLNVEMMDEDELRNELREELDELPFYFFCGFGFTNPVDRKSFGFVISTNGQREDLLTPEGALRNSFQQQIAGNFESAQ